MKHIPRFYVETELTAEADVALSKTQIHHATNVLRMKVGDRVQVFNELFGEWTCIISNIKKCTLRCEEMISGPHKSDRNVEIAFSIIQPNRMSVLLEKVTELGVTKIFLLKTQYSQHKNVNIEKLLQTLIGACEQCGRIDIPKIFPPENLQDFLKRHNEKTTLLVADEKQNEASKKLSYFSCSNPDIKRILIVGPEGGFSDNERELFDQHRYVERISLGRTTLRSETAAIICVASQTVFAKDSL